MVKNNRTLTLTLDAKSLAREGIHATLGRVLSAPLKGDASAAREIGARRGAGRIRH